MLRIRSLLLSAPSSIPRLAAGATPYHPSARLTRSLRVADKPFWSVFSRQGCQSFGSQASQTSQAPELIPSDVLVDEEIVPGYKPEHFYPANPGDVLDNRYELKAKIGWGSSSTVWLAQDISRKHGTSRNKYVAIKICTCNVSDNEAHELDITMHVCSVNSQHRGRVIVGTAIESFGLESPQGTSHLALVFEPLRDPLWLLVRRITGEDRANRQALPLLKAYLRILLEGLDFLHSECHVIHTDLKLDNIMVTFEDPSVIETFVQGQLNHPMARKRAGTRTVYRCHNDFGDIHGEKGLGKMYPKITDLGLAQRGDRSAPLLHPIQPKDCQAPEVLLGVGWSYSADMWNFGIIVWELLTGRGLFEQDDPSSYSAVKHLANMIAILGPVPSALVQRQKAMREWRWSPPVLNSGGQLCGTAAEFFGGPFFTEDGTFIGNHLVRHDRVWENELPGCIPREEADCFFKFMRRMLCWIPEDRATAGGLKSDPWLGDNTDA
ncbi:putative serine/threonine-protein kinase [Xylaria sp. FL0933]|nr:putative serine/threonine-protein kinase [Xylaria sp. FL0933]